MMIADINVPWTTTTSWMLGALGTLGAAFLLFGVINQARKLFGRRPPLDDQLSHLDRSLRKDMKKGDQAVERQIRSLRDDVNTQFNQMIEVRRDHGNEIKRSFETISHKLDEQTAVLTTSAERRTEATNEKIRDLSVAIGKLDERTKKL